MSGTFQHYYCVTVHLPSALAVTSIEQERREKEGPALFCIGLSANELIVIKKYRMSFSTKMVYMVVSVHCHYCVNQ